MFCCFTTLFYLLMKNLHDMKSHREKLKQYNKDLKEWKQKRLKSIMESDEYLQHKLGVEFDHRLTKGTMYKYLFPEYKDGFTRGFYEALNDPKEYEDFFINPSSIVEVQKIQKLKQRRDEAQQSGDLEKVNKYDHVISIEIGRFKHSGNETYFSPETLEVLDIDLTSINEIRVKCLQCSQTLHYIIVLHPWFKEILDELAEVGNPCPEAPKEVKQLRKEYKDLQEEQEYKELENKANGEKKLGFADLKLDKKIQDKHNELQVAQSEHIKAVSEHYDYLSNVIYELKKENYKGFYMNTRYLEQILRLFAWFYTRLFKAEKELYQKEQRAITNANRKKSTAPEKRKALIQKCKNKGLNKTAASKETGYSYPTVLKYWDLS